MPPMRYAHAGLTENAASPSITTSAPSKPPPTIPLGVGLMSSAWACAPCVKTSSAADAANDKHEYDEAFRIITAPSHPRGRTPFPGYAGAYHARSRAHKGGSTFMS